MRIGVFLEPSTNGNVAADVAAEAAAVERAGLDMCVIPERTFDASWSATVIAASLAASTSAVRVLALIGIGEHPVRIAEELIVTDLCLNGRLAAILSTDEIDAGDRESVLGETLAVLRPALAGIPFRHQGVRWQIPAGAGGGNGERMTVTPMAAQLELPLFALGLELAAVAAAGGAAPVARTTDTAGEAARAWSSLGEGVGAMPARRRIAIRSMPATEGAEGSSEVDELVTGLRNEQRTWGVDTCLLRWEEIPSLDRRLRTIEAIGTRVRPRVQLDSLPGGVEEMWSADAALVTASAAGRRTS